jgi:hypothetical protein
MSKLLTVGRIEDETAEDAAIAVADSVKPLPANWFGRVKTQSVRWLSCPPRIAEYDCLNTASVAAFLRHAAELEGIPAEERIGQSRWPHLPDYEQTYWLPMEFEQPRVFNPADGFHIAIASAPRLIQELEAIRAVSPHGLGAEPPGFDSSPSTSLGTEATLRWVWWALHLGATTALSREAPLAIE